MDDLVKRLSDYSSWVREEIIGIEDIDPDDLLNAALRIEELEAALMFYKENLGSQSTGGWWATGALLEDKGNRARKALKEDK